MLTLEQLYKLGLSLNIDIFGGISMPVNSPLDRELVINSIMEKCGLNIPLYADPYVMASAVNLWNAKNQYTFEHVGKIFSAEYSPIENTDKYESTTVERNRDMTDNTSGTNNKTEGLETANNNTEMNSGKDTTENTTSAMNASDYQPDDKSELTHGHRIETRNAGSSTRTTDTELATDKTIDEDETTTTTARIHGNIGVTTNTTLQIEEYKLLHDYNPFAFIAGLFENDLTLCIY
jgi:hypothetical protein